MSDMSEVLREHELAIDYAEYFACTCGTIQSTTNGHHPEHVATALSAAGFGPVQEAQARAYDKGYTHGRHDGEHHLSYRLSHTPRPEKSRRNPYRRTRNDDQ